MNCRSFLLATAFLFPALLVACAKDTPPVDTAGCRDAPTSCAAGTTCWPTDELGSFACLPSKSYKPQGSDCELLAGRAGCADGLICLSTDSRPDANVPVSYCAPFCDPQKSDCTAGSICTQLALFPAASSAVWACLDPLPLSHDAGPSPDAN